MKTLAFHGAMKRGITDMYRVEIIANKSVEEDISETLEAYIPNILYTIIPLAYGKGKLNRKMGTTSWPETNFVMVSYIEDDDLCKIKAVVKAIKEKFKDEGIKMFVLKAE